MLALLATLVPILFGQIAQAQTTPADSSQMSLAERAAAARQARPQAAADKSELTPQQRGMIRGTHYLNDFFGFQIDMTNQWQPFDAVRKAVSRAKAREIEAEMGVHDSSPVGNVLEVEDDAGGNVILTLSPLPAGAPDNIEEIATLVRRAIFTRIPSAKDVHERLFLGDSTHKFGALRYAITVLGVPLVQSKQLIRMNGFLMVFTVTGRSDQEVSSTLRALNARLSWSGSQAAIPGAANSQPLPQ